MALALTAALTFAPVAMDIAPGCPPIVARWCPPAESWGKPPPPPPSPIGEPLTGVERWRPMVEFYWDEPHTSRMLRIMRCESGGNPRAHNKSTDVRGLFQIRWPLWSKVWGGDYFDPWINAATAYQIWLTQGYRAWACKG